MGFESLHGEVLMYIWFVVNTMCIVYLFRSVRIPIARPVLKRKESTQQVDTHMLFVQIKYARNYACTFC